MSQRRNFTPQFKARVVLATLKKLCTTAQACWEYDLNEQVVTRWKAEFLERPSGARSARRRASAPGTDADGGALQPARLGSHYVEFFEQHGFARIDLYDL